MAKKKKKKIGKLEREYRSAMSGIRKSISRAREQGFDIEYVINKPDKLTRGFIKKLRRIKLDQVKAGVSMPGISIRTYQTGTGMDLRPTRNPAAKKPPKKKKETPPTPEPPTPEPPTPEPPTTEPVYTSDKPEYYIDQNTGEKFLPDDRRIYVTDDNGNIIKDKNGNPLIRSDLIPVTSKPLGSNEYSDLVWQYILENYDLNISVKDQGAQENKAAFYKWLKEMREKYGVFALRDALARAGDSGYPINRSAFYKSDAEFSSILSAIHTMLQLGEYNNDDLMDLSDAADGADGGYEDYF